MPWSLLIGVFFWFRVRVAWEVRHPDAWAAGSAPGLSPLPGLRVVPVSSCTQGPVPRSQTRSALCRRTASECLKHALSTPRDSDARGLRLFPGFAFLKSSVGTLESQGRHQHFEALGKKSLCWLLSAAKGTGEKSCITHSNFTYGAF